MATHSLAAPPRDVPAVSRAQGEDLEDEQIERAMEQLRCRLHGWPLLSLDSHLGLKERAGSDGIVDAASLGETEVAGFVAGASAGRHLGGTAHVASGRREGE